MLNQNGFSIIYAALAYMDVGKEREQGCGSFAYRTTASRSLTQCQRDTRASMHIVLGGGHSPILSKLYVALLVLFLGFTRYLM